MPTFIRLTDYRSSDAKEEEFFELGNRYKTEQEDFSKIPGSPFAYWLSNNLSSTFSRCLNNSSLLKWSYNSVINFETGNSSF